MLIQRYWKPGERADLVIGAAVCGLALVAAGVWLFRRSPAAGEAGELEAEIDAGDGAGDGEPLPEEGQGDVPQAPIDFPSGDQHRDLPLRYFFLLTYLLAIPFWLFGGNKLPLPINLPVSALVTFVPMIAACLVCYWQSGSPGVKNLLKKAFDYRKISHKRWYLPILGLMPLIGVLSYVLLRLAGAPLPENVTIPLLAVLVFFILFFIGDAGEELGWSGYAIDPMQKRWGALRASLVLSLIWVTWHIIPWVQTGNPTRWIVWQGIFTIASRILTVWIYNNTGKSVFATILFHVMSNLSWSLFPNYGSHYNPAVTAGLTWLAALGAAFGWGASTLARFRFGKPAQVGGI